MPALRTLTAEECAPVLRAIAEPTRLRILSVLRGGPLAVFELTEQLGIKQYQASRHLAALHDIGVVTRERSGKRVVYRLAPAVSDASGDGPAVELGCCRVSVA
ncbi:MAG: metalloregulator ArsR/SmtB family transcription factor [Myxococcota bacterium]